jgi:hypothetical protein
VTHRTALKFPDFERARARLAGPGLKEWRAHTAGDGAHSAQALLRTASQAADRMRPKIERPTWDELTQELERNSSGRNRWRIIERLQQMERDFNIYAQAIEAADSSFCRWLLTQSLTDRPRYMPLARAFGVRRNQIDRLRQQWQERKARDPEWSRALSEEYRTPL